MITLLRLQLLPTGISVHRPPFPLKQSKYHMRRLRQICKKISDNIDAGFSKVWPGEFGVPQPYLFFLRRPQRTKTRPTSDSVRTDAEEPIPSRGVVVKNVSKSYIDSFGRAGSPALQKVLGGVVRKTLDGCDGAPRHFVHDQTHFVPIYQL